MAKKNSFPTVHFSNEEILKREDQFIQSYRKNSGHFLRIFLSLFKGNYKNLLLSAFFFVLKACPEWILPLITADIINLATEKPVNAGPRFLFDLVLALVVLAQNIPNHMLHIRYLSRANRSVEAGLRGAMIRQLQQLSIPFHKEMPSGRIQSKVMRDVENIEGFSTQIFTTVLRVVITMSITLGVVLSKSLPVFFMFLAVVPFASLITSRFRKPMHNSNRDFRQSVEHTSADVMDMIELVPVTRAHALENKEINKLTGEMANIAEQGYRLDKIQSLFGSINWCLFSLFQIICLAFTGYLTYKGTIKNVGDITLYQTYFASLIGQVSSIINLMPVLSKGAESIHSVGEILCAGDLEDNTGKKKLNHLDGAYEFRDIFFSYDRDTPVLKGLNLTVKKGETIALVGESGSGKSTILNLVTGFYKPSNGSVIIDGNDLNDIDLRSYRRFLSVVPQKTILFSGTIRDNITYGNPHITKAQLDAVIDAAQLRSVIQRLPNGLDTNVGEHGDKLSGGQKQRVSIARAIIRNPQVIIFDEATSALDSVSEQQIQMAIDHLTKDRTTFIVAHRLSTIKNADRIAVIKDGHCVECGTYEELMEKKGEFYALKQIQS